LSGACLALHVFYKLSNNCQRNAIEHTFGRPFKFPKIYERNPIINGVQEQLLPVITDHDAQVNYAIWGILPTHYTGDWKAYQNIQNTLNFPPSESLFYSAAAFSNIKKCVIIVTGFFVSHLKDGSMYTYYVYKENEQPFLLGGLYTVLEDGFLTCTMAYTKANAFIQNINNINGYMPLIIDHSKLSDWLESGLEENTQQQYHTEKLFAHTISKQFYDNDILFDSVLEPIPYKDIPNFECPNHMSKN
tara:strand:- start:436 stop:1173 length:738 start_codon:yes stop_codon:yes gene_type:complete